MNTQICHHLSDETISHTPEDVFLQICKLAHRQNKDNTLYHVMYPFITNTFVYATQYEGQPNYLIFNFDFEKQQLKYLHNVVYNSKQDLFLMNKESRNDIQKLKDVLKWKFSIKKNILEVHDWRSTRKTQFTFDPNNLSHQQRAAHLKNNNCIPKKHSNLFCIELLQKSTLL